MEWLLITHSLTWSSLFPFYHITGSVQMHPSNPYLSNLIYLSSLIFAILLAACSGTSSTKLSELCEVYAEIADNKAKMAEAFQKVYTANRDEQEALQAKAEAISKEMSEKNEQLAAKAKQLGEALLNSEMPCEVGAGLSYKVDKAVFTTVQANPNLANIVITATPEGEAVGTQYVLMLDGNGDVLNRTLARCSDGKISVNFRVTTNKGSDVAKAYGAVRTLKFVTESEYKTGKAPQDNNEQNELETNVSENEETPEPEPAYIGENNAPSPETVTVDGVAIKKGAPLAETLRKFKNITWDYNADFGVTATVGNVWITIDESDLTQKGQDIINAILSDMENNISFSVDYIKPTAKISQFEAQ